MLVLEASRLVFLANPKTATQSIRAMLRPMAARGPWQEDPSSRHCGIGPFNRKWRAVTEARLGGPVEVFAVVREPVSRLGSWYRYRSKNPAGDAKSTYGLSFAQFVEAVLRDDPPDYARVGVQDRFTGWNGTKAGIDVLFDYARLDLMRDYLSDRVGQRLFLPVKNVSAVPAGSLPELPADLMAGLRSKFAGDFALHAAVAETGVLFADD